MGKAIISILRIKGLLKKIHFNVRQNKEIKTFQKKQRQVAHQRISEHFFMAIARWIGGGIDDALHGNRCYTR